LRRKRHASPKRRRPRHAGRPGRPSKPRASALTKKSFIKSTTRRGASRSGRQFPPG
jgi:hypothetical protein